MLEFSDNQTMASLSSAQEYVSTDICDLGAGETNAFGTTILPEIGNAGELIWHVLIGTTLAGASNTITVELITKSTAASMSASSTILDTFSIPTDTLAGTHYQRPVPMEAMAASDRYMAVLYRGATAQTTGGNIDSWISMDRNLTESNKGAIV